MESRDLDFYIHLAAGGDGARLYPCCLGSAAGRWQSWGRAIDCDSVVRAFLRLVLTDTAALLTLS